MPAHHAKDPHDKKQVEKATQQNIHELSHNNSKGRSHEQIVAIAINEAKSKPKK